MYADYLLLISSTCNDLRSVVELRKKQWGDDTEPPKAPRHYLESSTTR